MASQTSVFNQDSQNYTVTAIPGALRDSNFPIQSPSINLTSVGSSAFFYNSNPAQNQSQISSDDQTFGIQTITVKRTQTINVEEDQKTTVHGQITTQSKTGKIRITAATDIIFEVGQSMIHMKSDGTVQIVGKNILIIGDNITSEAVLEHITRGQSVLADAISNNTILGGRIDLNF